MKRALTFSILFDEDEPKASASVTITEIEDDRWTRTVRILGEQTYMPPMPAEESVLPWAIACSANMRTLLEDALVDVAESASGKLMLNWHGRNES